MKKNRELTHGFLMVFTQEKPVIALVDISFKQEMSATLPSGSEGQAGFDIVRELSARSPYTKCIMYSS